MPKPKSAMEILKLLDNSNCRECGEKTCLAFAGAVYRGQRSLSECPKLDAETVDKYGGSEKQGNELAEMQDAHLESLRARIAEIDLREAAERTGGRYANGKLTVKIMGKDFSVEDNGTIRTDIHVNPWVTMTFFSYVLEGKGVPVSGNWMSYRELKGGRERYPLFQKRSEESLKRIADAFPTLFDDMVHLFSGKQVSPEFESDISVLLHPFPYVPMMICYWMPEEGIDSSLNLFFDETSPENIGIDGVYSLGAGFAQMIEKLAHRHGFDESAAGRG